jgi:hypothetical protein
MASQIVPQVLQVVCIGHESTAGVEASAVRLGAAVVACAVFAVGVAFVVILGVVTGAAVLTFGVVAPLACVASFLGVVAGAATLTFGVVAALTCVAAFLGPVTAPVAFGAMVAALSVVETLAFGVLTFGALTLGTFAFGALTLGTFTFGALTLGTDTFGTFTFDAPSFGVLTFSARSSKDAKVGRGTGRASATSVTDRSTARSCTKAMRILRGARLQ